MRTDYEFAEAPPEVVSGGPRYGRGKWADFFDAVREHPDQWAKMPRLYGDASIVGYLKHGGFMGTEPGEFDATARKVGDGEYEVWVTCAGGAA